MIQQQHIDGLEIFSAAPARRRPRPTPLLFIHGAFAGGWMWNETFMPFFARAGYAAYAVSLRGHGGSDGREAMHWHSIGDYVQDVAKAVDWVVAESGASPVLIGHSMGGFVCQKYLEGRAAPGVVLLCSVPPQGLVAAQFHLLFSKPRLFLDLNHVLNGDVPATDTLREALFAGEVDEAMLHAWLGRMQNESHRALWDMSLLDLPRLHAMRRPPMLILGAENDALVPAFLVTATARAYGLPCHIFPAMGHAVTHEKAWPEVAALVLGWLKEQAF